MVDGSGRKKSEKLKAIKSDRMSERAAADPENKMCEIRVENVQPKDIGKWK